MRTRGGGILSEVSLKGGGTPPCELRDRQVPSRGQLQGPAQTLYTDTNWSMGVGQRMRQAWFSQCSPIAEQT